MADIVVIGSANIDLTVSMGKIPSVGETVLGDSLFIREGGKGANQAVAAARLGGSTAFIGCVGGDEYGRRLLTKLKNEGIDCSKVSVCKDCPTGTAVIFLDRKGKNCIAVISGANIKVNEARVDAARELIWDAKVVLLQHEIPQQTVEYAAQMAVKKSVSVILNPAPAREISRDLYDNISIIIPNENEAAELTGIDGKTEDAVKRQAEWFHEKGVKNVIITMGANGAFVSTERETKQIPSLKVEAVDTVAAGDCFCGALAAAYARGEDIFSCVKFAVRAAAVSVTRSGAMDSIPRLAEI